MFSCVPNNYRLEITMICIVLELVAMEHNNEAMMHSNRYKGILITLSTFENLRKPGSVL